MKPGTKPKPTHLKLIEGNRGKRPLNRKEAVEPSGERKPHRQRDLFLLGLFPVQQ